MLHDVVVIQSRSQSPRAFWSTCLGADQKARGLWERDWLSFGQARATCACVLLSSIFNTQNVATRRNKVAKPTQHVAPNNVAIVWSELANVGPKTLYDMLCLYVAIIWPGVKNA